MKSTIKLAVKYLSYGISMGCTSFVVMCLSYAALGGDAFLEAVFQDFARQALGAMLVGIACGSTAIIYQFNRPSRPLKILIHFLVGMGVFYPVSIHLGWIPFHPDRILFTLVQFLFSCGIFLLIWSLFYLFNRSEANRINKRLRELERNGGPTDISGFKVKK